MKRIARVSAFALVCVVGWTGSGLAAELDTSGLPRVSGAKNTYVSPATTIYVSPNSVAQTADATRKALAAGGWQLYVAPLSARAEDPNMEIMTFKKGPQALNVFITLAAAQGNATSVSYTAVALPTDLPFPPDATNIEFDPNRPLLMAVSADAIDKLLAFYRKELGTLEWSLWSAKVGGKQPDGGANGEVHDKGAYAYYIRDGKTPLVLTLQPTPDGRNKVEIKAVPAQVLASARQAEINRNNPPAVSTPAPAPAPVAPPQRTATDDMADQMMKQAQDLMRDAMRDALSGAKPPAAPAPKATGEALRASTSTDAPIPVPENAEAVEFDAADGKLEFWCDGGTKQLHYMYPYGLSEWHHITGVADGVNMYIYVDAVLVASRTFATTNYGSSAKDFNVGGNVAGAGQYFPGTIDEVFAYDRALSASEVALLYANQPP
jgi:hypothetical protein